MTSFTTTTRILHGFPFLCKWRLFCHLNLAGITKFKYEKKNEKDSGRSSKMTPLCKWSIGNPISTLLSVLLHLTQEKRRCRSDVICIRYFCAILKFDLLPPTWQTSFPERAAMIFWYWCWADDNSTLKFYRTVSKFSLNFFLFKMNWPLSVTYGNITGIGLKPCMDTATLRTTWRRSGLSGQLIGTKSCKVMFVWNWKKLIKSEGKLSTACQVNHH